MLLKHSLINLKKQVRNQTNITQRYAQNVSPGRILYVMRVNGINKNIFIVSYMYDTYRNSLYANLVQKVVFCNDYCVNHMRCSCKISVSEACGTFKGVAGQGEKNRHEAVA